MLVGEYASMFEELTRYCPYYELEANIRSKCVKFEIGLKPELKTMFGHQKISDFPTLVNKCRMYEDDMKANDVAMNKANPLRNFGPRRNYMQGRGKGKAFHEERKPYAPPTGNWWYTHKDQSLTPMWEGHNKTLQQYATNVAEATSKTFVPEWETIIYTVRSLNM
ncbi:hypothetical protein Lal_00032082 [Lupinus albus]|nr:hypothetical protein Lal_00032082 [Lupinus albus]